MLVLIHKCLARLLNWKKFEEILTDPSGQTLQLLTLKSDLGLQLCFKALLWKFMCQNCPIWIADWLSYSQQLAKEWSDWANTCNFTCTCQQQWSENSKITASSDYPWQFSWVMTNVLLSHPVFQTHNSL